jgi:hypothetical protein
MADLDPRSAAKVEGKVESPAPSGNAPDSSPRNGQPDASAVAGQLHGPASHPGAAGNEQQAAAGDGHDDRSGLEQAEVIVDNLADKVASLVGVWGRKFLRLTSRARESAQDFWAEVQDFRQGKKP